MAEFDFSNNNVDAMALDRGVSPDQIRQELIAKGKTFQQPQALQDIASPLETASTLPAARHLPPGARLGESFAAAGRGFSEGLAGSREHFRTKTPEEIAAAQSAEAGAPALAPEGVAPGEPAAGAAAAAGPAGNVTTFVPGAEVTAGVRARGAGIGAVAAAKKVGGQFAAEELAAAGRKAGS